MPALHLLRRSTSFVGRQTELDAIDELLGNPNCRLLTVLGVGGTGKTRLALQAGNRQEAQFKDGVIEVALAPVIRADMLALSMAEAFKLSSGRGQPEDQVIHYLQDKHLLLILDNFEHLIEQAGFLSDILQNAPQLKILVTSRERLNLQEEWVFTLEGLSYPAAANDDAITDYSAVELFAQRARQAQTYFSVGDHVQAVQAICARVEGMPLAIELAASWLHVLTCEQVAERLNQSLDFLASPYRDTSTRHHSLRAVFEQSWILLSASEQAVFMRLSVFHGGFDLAAAEQVTGATFVLLAGLVDKSLVRFQMTGRYDLHELLRQYAADKLMEAELLDAAEQAHLEYFVRLADEAEAHLFSSQQVAWFDQLELEFDNLRAALARSVNSEIGLHLAAALGWFFSERCYRNEGLLWTEQALTANPNAPATLRAKALQRAGAFAGYFGDEKRTDAYFGEAIPLARAIHDDKNLAWSLSYQGMMVMDASLDKSTEYFEESLRLFRKIDDPMGIAHTLVRFSWNAVRQQNFAYATQLVDEAAVLIFRAGDTIMEAWLAISRGRIAEHRRDFLLAKMHYENALVQFRNARFPDGMTTLVSLAHVAMKLKEIDLAEVYYREALTSHISLVPNHAYVPIMLAGFAGIAKARDQFERAARLLAAAQDEWLSDWARMDPETIPYEGDIEAVRSRLGESAFETAWAAGEAMTRREAITYALEEPPTPRNKLPVQGLLELNLSKREHEILRLMVNGLNSREIADALFLSVQTVRWYLKNIYSKLDAHSRSEAIAHAKALHLLT